MDQWLIQYIIIIIIIIIIIKIYFLTATKYTIEYYIKWAITPAAKDAAN